VRERRAGAPETVQEWCQVWKRWKKVSASSATRGALTWSVIGTRSGAVGTSRRSSVCDAPRCMRCVTVGCSVSAPLPATARRSVWLVDSRALSTLMFQPLMPTHVAGPYTWTLIDI
jgi:hypothetical protein